MTPEPGNREKLADGIARALEAEIVLGRMRPGQRLGEEELSERFSATRHHVRAALTALERTGIVRKERNKGYSVRSFSVAEVEEIYELREILQRQAALRIALPVPPEKLEALTDLELEYERAVEAGDLRRIHAANDLFHAAMFALCNNARLAELVGQYMDLSYLIRGNAFEHEHCLVAIREHRLMLSLLASRDSWSLAQACVDHMQYSKNQYLSMLSAGRGETERAA
ncbi:MAG: GntR family transcriptional regulator [Acetobacteraceae bacterium]|nr:GntR family transcriptional regulator [Acetobacteraceae bacterium]